MNDKREYVRRSESLHPNAIEFSAFVHKMHGQGKRVTRSTAIKWIISSYKREALIRYGANERATTALRAEQIAGDSRRKRKGLTRSAILFSRDGSTITEKEAEAFFDTGISVVMQRLVHSRAGTYLYDKVLKEFGPISSTSTALRARSVGVNKKILSALSEGDMSAGVIAQKYGLDVCRVRNNLNQLRRAGAVDRAGKQKGTGRGKTQIIYRLKKPSDASRHAANTKDCDDEHTR
jgi:hypothetical protein